MRAHGLKAPLCAAIGFAAMGAGPAAAQTDALAPAREGQLQCYAPNVAQKTCRSLAGYTFDRQGAIMNQSETVIMPEPLIVMSLASAVTVRGGAVCGPLRASDIDGATFTIDGHAATPEDTQTIRAELRQQLVPIIDVDMCVTFAPVEGGGFRADSTMNGAPHPEMSQPVIWVRRSDGWRVAP